MLAGHSYRITLQSSVEDTSWVPAVFVGRYPQTEVMSAASVGPGQVELTTYWRSNTTDIKPGDTIEAEIPGFPGPSASASVTAIEDVGLPTEAALALRFSPWPLLGAVAILSFVVWATMRVKQKRA